MHGPEHWYSGRAPQTSAERLQAEVEAMYARQDEAERRARAEEAPRAATPMCRRCQQRTADGSGVFCSECWADIGPYDRPIDDE